MSNIEMRFEEFAENPDMRLSDLVDLIEKKQQGVESPVVGVSRDDGVELDGFSDVDR